MVRLTTVKATRERDLPQLVDPEVWERNRLGTARFAGCQQCRRRFLGEPARRPLCPASALSGSLPGWRGSCVTGLVGLTFLSADLYAME